MKTRLLATAALAAGFLLAPAPSYAALPDATVQYSDPLSYTIRWTQQDGSHVSLSVTGLPDQLTFTDNGDNTGVISGIADVAAGTYPYTLTATRGDGVQFDEPGNVVVMREDAVVRLAKTNPERATRTKPFVLKAKVKDTPDRSLGDITKATPGVFILEDVRGHLRTCAAKMVKGSLDTGAGPDFYDVRCKVPAGLHRGKYRVTYAVSGDYYAGHAGGAVQITR